MTTVKLFACYLGGRIPGCKIEMHDVAFCVGETIEDCYDGLLQQWPGERKGLHIDAYAAITQVDGHEVYLEKSSESLETSEKQLYFINLGGYNPLTFGELHPTGFWVASDKQEAKVRAKQTLGAGLSILHTDDALGVDDCLSLSDYLDGYQLRLTPCGDMPPLEFTCGYHLIPETPLAVCAS